MHPLRNSPVFLKSSTGFGPDFQTQAPVSAITAGSCQPTPRPSSDSTGSQPLSTLQPPLPPRPAPCLYSHSFSDTVGEMAQLTIYSPGIAFSGTSSHPPAKSTRSGECAGAFTRESTCVLVVCPASGRDFSSTTNSIPCSSQNRRFASMYWSSVVTARTCGLTFRQAVRNERATSSSEERMTSSTMERALITASLSESSRTDFLSYTLHSKSAGGYETIR